MFSQPPSRAASASQLSEVEAPEGEEAELVVSENKGGGSFLSVSDTLRETRLDSEEAMNTFLLEKSFKESWKHRQLLHSAVRENAAHKSQVGTGLLAEKLVQESRTPKKGVVRFECDLAFFLLLNALVLKFN